MNFFKKLVKSKYSNSYEIFKKTREITSEDELEDEELELLALDSESESELLRFTGLRGRCGGFLAGDFLLLLLGIILFMDFLTNSNRSRRLISADFDLNKTS